MRKLWVGLLLVVALAAVDAIHDGGASGAFAQLVAELREAVSFEPAARRDEHDGTMDAFQRAYSKSEDRVDELLDGSSSAE